MATRRIVASEKTILEKDDRVGSSPAAGEKSNITPAVPMEVIIKLLGFTLAMVVLPIGTYFATVDFIFKGTFAVFERALSLESGGQTANRRPQATLRSQEAWPP